MKKFLALLMLVCIAMMPVAMAEAVTWDEVGAPAVEAFGLEGDFVALSDMGLAIWVPSTMYQAEVAEEDAEYRYALFMDEDGECYLAVDAINQEGMTLDQAYENAVANGMTEPEIVNVNGLDALSYKDETNNIGCIVLVDTNSNMIIFSFGPIDSEAAETAFGIIGSSLMPAE